MAVRVQEPVPAFQTVDIGGAPFQASDLIARAPVLVALLRGLF